jgi:hypothetical protein
MASNRKQKTEKPAIFTPAELIAGAGHFNASPEMMAGALYGVTEPITKEEAARHLEKFKTKGVR